MHLQNIMDEQVLQEGDSSLNSTIYLCNVHFNLGTWMLLSLIPAVAIFLLFCFLEQRVHLWPTCCQGRPGVAYPANLVDSYSDRWSFAFAFGSMSTTFAAFLLDSGTSFTEVPLMLQGTVQILLAIADGLLTSMVFYPILLCLRTKWTLLGNILGLLYSCAWFAYYLGRCALQCGQENLNDDSGVFRVMATLGGYGIGIICFFALMIRFSIGLIKDVLSRVKVLGTAPDSQGVDFTKTHFYHRVRFLLTTPQSAKASVSKHLIIRLFQRYIGTVPGFRFSRRCVCTLMLTWVTTIQVAFVYLWLLGLIVEDLSQSLESEVFNQVKAAFWVTSLVSVIFTTIYTIDMQLRYRKHTVKLWKGDRSFCSEERASFDSMLVCSLRYSGYQVAFSVWGFIILQVLLWAVSSFIILFKDYALSLLEKYWLALVVSYGFYFGQAFISRLVFLQKAPDDRQSRFVCTRKTYFGLDNRRIFHVTVYITLFINFLLGMLSCFVRIFMSLAFGTLFIGRLDRCILMRGWELWDVGFKAYIGFLELEVAHTHPVLITFCHFLLKSVKTHMSMSQKNSTSELVSIVGASAYAEERNVEHQGISDIVPEISANPVSQRIRNKWLVALTLARNPKLALERKRALMDAKQEHREVSQKGGWSPGEEDV